MATKIKEKREELNTIRNASDSLRQQCDVLDSKQRKELLSTQDKLKRGSSVSKWRTDRSILKNKLKTITKFIEIIIIINILIKFRIIVKK